MTEGGTSGRFGTPGEDFADLRPYVPGDRLRDLSWAASARSDEPWVVVHHPDGTREEVETTGLDLEGRLCVTGARGSDTVAAGDVRHIRLPGASPH